MERVDLYDANGNKTGRVIVRGKDPVGEGEYIMSVGIWVKNREGKIFVTHRSPAKSFAPDKWENSAGHVIEGETPEEGILRELFEETGVIVKKEQMTYLGRTVEWPGIGLNYGVLLDEEPKEVRLQPGETDDYKWISREEFYRMRDEEAFAPSVFTALRGYRDGFKNFMGWDAFEKVEGAPVNVPGFSKERYEALVNRRVSILSNCCWGGLTYHYFHMQFLSPTIDLFMDEKDYLRFLRELPTLMGKEPVLVGQGFNLAENLEYPIFSLNGIKLHMNHCRDLKEGLDRWMARSRRLNFDNLLVMMATQSEEAAAEFSKLPFEHKVCFVPFETSLEACVTVHPGAVPFMEYVNSFATGVRRLYDPWILLEEGRVVIAEDSTELGARDEARTAVHKELSSAKYVLIYGAWNVGKRALSMIKALREKERFGFDLLGFAVSSMEGNLESVEGLRVRTLKEWEAMFKTKETASAKTQGQDPDKDWDMSDDGQAQALVVTALHPKYYEEVRSALTMAGFSTIMTFEALSQYYYEVQESGASLV